MSAVEEAAEERLSPPPRSELPLFVYGMLKPDEIAYDQIRRHVKRSEPATLSGHILGTRDGLPSLTPANDAVAEGMVLWFTDQEAAYNAVCRFEPRHLYKWAEVDVPVAGTPVRANALLGRSPTRNAAEEHIQSWSSSMDPVFRHALPTVHGMVVRTHPRARPNGPGWDTISAIAFYELQAALMLAMSVAEHYTALKFGPAIGPTERIRQLQDSAVARNALGARAAELAGKRVFDSRNPADVIRFGADGKRAWEYWYQVRSNVNHRGKATTRDADLVRESVVDVHDVLRKILLAEIPTLKSVWSEIDGAGEATAWSLRSHLQEPPR